ncbi:hypothetical protein EZV62_014820 [Acer yangbiense]|uniref:CCHC-type domain-containing protein n=1 Tax=Acer yangbiense TaxID=1000413 RepID=A0A5C7HT25_9ROSI|nr:hypothetical protein EZV62_014820 [Acer yangbiense]
MSANEIARLCENLSIKDEDREILQVSGGVENEGVKGVDHCLVGKVLLGRRVNREAFKTVIEQLWIPFGNVEIEVVGENVFMFYFNNLEDRNKVWQKGLWHFDKSLLVLEKPEGMGEISKLTESRDCWGKFLRVKVRIDISRPLKRWLRLSLDKSGNIVVVGLKYERMPKFCYACGKVGHALNECPDMEAKKEAMEGTNPRFGWWISHESGKKRVLAIEGVPTISHGSAPSKVMTVDRRTAVENSLETLGEWKLEDQTVTDQMCVDEPTSGPSRSELNKAQEEQELTNRLTDEAQSSKEMEPYPKGVSGKPGSHSLSPKHNTSKQCPILESQSSPKALRKKWKRMARERQSTLVAGLMVSPLQHKLAVSISALKKAGRNSLSPNSTKKSPKLNFSKGIMSPGMLRPNSHNANSDPSSPLPGTQVQSCKRRVVFEDFVEVRDPKRKRYIDPVTNNPISTERGEQARREP